MSDKTNVVVKLKGGMGNQMFQYAFGKALAHTAAEKGVTIDLSFDILGYTDPNTKDTRRPYMLDLLNTEATIADDSLALTARNPYGIASKVLRRSKEVLGMANTVAYKPELLEPPYQPYYEGYWQSEQYFLPIAEQLRQEFTLKQPLGDAEKAAHELVIADDNAVSIFYRRTDYVGHSKFDIGEQAYQKRAIEKIAELVPNFKLYVMSDDINWVKENADLPANSVFVSSKAIPPEKEMMIAAACRHHIIPNSTFAWWGAWLNNNPEQIVITPSEWARNDNGRHKDVVPDRWLRVSQKKDASTPFINY